jgi:hypothetical protein
VYQQAPVGALAFAVVGATDENEAVFFELHR